MREGDGGGEEKSSKMNSSTEGKIVEGRGGGGGEEETIRVDVRERERERRGWPWGGGYY